MEERKNGLTSAFQKSIAAGMTTFLLANGAMAATLAELTPDQKRELVTAHFDKAITNAKVRGVENKENCQTNFSRQRETISQRVGRGISLADLVGHTTANEQTLKRCIENAQALETRHIKLFENAKERHVEVISSSKPPKPKS